MSRHFVLVHGASHGGWCWYKVKAALESAGHKVTTLDMAASGLHPKHVHEVNSPFDYARPLLDFMEQVATEKVVLVGHSMGGPSISLAMEYYPNRISVAVFLAAIMLPPSDSTALRTAADAQAVALMRNSNLAAYNKSNVDASDTKYLYGDGPNNAPTAMMQGPKFLKSNYYRLSPPEDYALGETLWRYLPVKAMYLNELVLTKDRYGSVPRVYIVCDPEKDKLWQEALITIYPPKEVKVLDGSDHMAMFSTPNKLVFLLQDIGNRYP